MIQFLSKPASNNAWRPDNEMHSQEIINELFHVRKHGTFYQYRGESVHIHKILIEGDILGNVRVVRPGPCVCFAIDAKIYEIQ